MMEEHQVVPDIIDSAPVNIVDVSYNGNKVDFGKELTPTQVKDEPKISWEADKGTLYTLIMSDPDAPSRQDPKLGEVIHWLVINIPGADVSKGETLIPYVGSGPPKGTGLHRYIFLVYKQSGKLTDDDPRFASPTARESRLNFKTRDFVAKHKLDLLAGNFYQAQYDSYVDILHAKMRK